LFHASNRRSAPVHEARHRHHRALLGQVGGAELTPFMVNSKLLSETQWALARQAMGEKPYFLCSANR
jgi:hypothetical protein